MVATNETQSTSAVERTCVYCKPASKRTPEPTACGGACVLDCNMCYEHMLETLKVFVSQQGAQLKSAEAPVKKPKKEKDPNAPKRPRSGYLFWCEEHRGVLKRTHPEISQTEMMTKCGESWKKLTDKKRIKYMELAQKDKARFTTELSKYHSRLGSGSE